MKTLALLLLASISLMAIGCAATTPEAAAPVPAQPQKQVLFDGKDLSGWVSKNGGSEAKWALMEDGSMEVAKGDIVTKEKFKDFHLHVEFWCPNMPDKKGQAKANSGVYLMDCYEVQVLDSYGLESKKDDCGSIYNQKAPDVNACLPPEQWQTFEIDFRAARFDSEGKRTEKPRVTVVQNGKMIHKDVEIDGPTRLGDPETNGPGPIRLQDHGNKVRYRNIWVVPAASASDGKESK